MKITESKLREMIRGVITEFQTTATGTGGAEKKGFKSQTRKTAQSDYDTSVSDFQSARDAYDAAVAAKDDSRRYKSVKKGARDIYAADTRGRRPSGYGPWTTNSDWTQQSSDVFTTGATKSAASTTMTSADTALDTATASDLEKTVPKQKPPAGGGAGFGKGKTAGKAGKKGKKKKN